MKDELPAGLTYVEGSASLNVPAGFSPATPAFIWDSRLRTITWDFGTVVQQPPAGNLVITYQARVENILTNQDGVPLPNKATFTYGSPATSITSSKTITVGEPNLYLEKSPQTTPVALVAGATIRYRVEFRNDGDTTAYQAYWEDVLPFVSAGPPVNGLGNISNPGLVIVTGGVSANNTSTALTTGDLSITTANSSNDKRQGFKNSLVLHDNELPGLAILGGL